MAGVMGFLLICFWLYMLVCLAAPRAFFIKNTRRWELLLWILGGTIVFTFWGVYFNGNCGFLVALFMTAVGVLIGRFPALLRNQKDQEKLAKEIAHLQSMGAKAKTARKSVPVSARAQAADNTYGISARQNVIRQSREILQNTIAEAKDLWSDPDGHIVAIDYTDAEGNKSHRKIKITEIKMNEYGGVYLEAYCFKSRRAKSFRMDRIDCIYTESGRVISEDALFKALGIQA
jgi:hypothetical protein